ncbi:MAG: hypothetical protein KF819_10575 [Labilithrix sp.]|nr:hypothetical protein [Labilithrix sp.]
MTRAWLGPRHACTMQKTGEIACWGANDAGQLGDGTFVSRPLPKPARAARADALSLGDGHTCGLFAGRVRCWGATMLAENTILDATAIASGGEQACAIAGGRVRCWGAKATMPSEPEAFKGARATAIAVGPSHVCVALADPAVVRCSGSDARGQAAASVDLLAGASIASLTAGAEHTCAALADGSVRCWGANDKGQLGDATTTDSRVPVMVHGIPPVASIHAGARHTCARLRTGTVGCWGNNDRYQLANGTMEPSAKPVALPGLVGVQELAVAGDSACARMADGGVRCWGDNASGQLGDGTTNEHAVPMPIKWW